ncbi:MAG: hypothetical protein HWE20_10140 [Gammaproteobacteria bacterium]|nr:hypothetical protein [Gammaproteobacteria bacterium]
MVALESFSMRILDELDDSIAVLNRKGVIQFVNRSWIKFGQENGVNPSFDWIGKNYLAACTAIDDQDSRTQHAYEGINDVLLNKRKNPPRAPLSQPAGTALVCDEGDAIQA